MSKSFRLLPAMQNHQSKPTRMYEVSQCTTSETTGAICREFEMRRCDNQGRYVKFGEGDFFSSSVRWPWVWFGAVSDWMRASHFQKHRPQMQTKRVPPHTGCFYYRQNVREEDGSRKCPHYLCTRIINKELEVK